MVHETVDEKPGLNGEILRVWTQFDAAKLLLLDKNVTLAEIAVQLADKIRAIDSDEATDDWILSA